MWCRDWSIPPPTHEIGFAAPDTRPPDRAPSTGWVDATPARGEHPSRPDLDLPADEARMPLLRLISDPGFVTSERASRAPALLRQLSRELALATPSARGTGDWGTGHGSWTLPCPWSVQWSNAVLWEPHFPRSPHIPMRPNAVLPTRTYLGLTLAPRGALPPWLPTSRLALTLTPFADDLLVQGERRAVLSLASLASAEWAEQGDDVGTDSDDASTRATRGDDRGPEAPEPALTWGGGTWDADLFAPRRDSGELEQSDIAEVD